VTVEYRSILDAEGWDYVTRAADAVPRGFPVGRYPEDSVLISALARAGAIRTLTILQEALEVYFADIILAGFRTTLMVPSGVLPAPRVELSDNLWAQLFEVPWACPDSSGPDV